MILRLDDAAVLAPALEDLHPTANVSLCKSLKPG